MLGKTRASRGASGAPSQWATADPVPVNPAIVAPVDIGLDDGTTFNEGNQFELTTLEPDIDLTSLPISWVFELSSGSIDHNMVVQVDADNRGARLDFPLISFGNFGTGRMLFVLGPNPPGSTPMPCAAADTLVRNSILDIEQKDFRFQVKAHLTTDGAGSGTTRTIAEVQSIMSDVTKVLSQCGIIVTAGEIVTTTVSPEYIRLDSTSAVALHGLFGFGPDDSIIDVYFVEAIDYDANQTCGQTPGITSSPGTEIIWQGGIAIGDNVCDGDPGLNAAVRTFAHELVHYLFNHDDADADADHDENEARNLMSRGQSVTKRDLTTTQCLEIRANRGGN